MKKYLCLALFFNLILMSAPLAGLAQEEETQTTTTGVVFKRNYQFPQLGDAWLAPATESTKSIIWGDLAMDNKGARLNLTIYEAVQYCASIGARLPTVSDFVTLRRQFGVKHPEFLPAYEGYKAQILPHLETGDWYWAWPGDSSGKIYEFISSYGTINWNDPADIEKFNPHSQARCVIDI